ncbi:MAG: 4-(cytidine 5'-diphospho)-2-C-methyl-D-erythritol kinase [Rhodospirillaceae bacterium]|nr:MAG: 4-(cytidine 5'-diphospho)-2-C-methyl-D-erythritol kinase [Rhodospirillaceae bacterium]
MSVPVTVFAPAKLNLFLHVLGRRVDGYHDLESLFVFLDIGDHLHFEASSPVADSSRSAEGVLHFPDPDIPQQQNLAWQALQRVRVVEPRLPAPVIRVDKSLPLQAGLGGGSADAAAVVHWAESLFPSPDHRADFRTAVADLGADLPPAMDGRARIWRGTGDVPGRLIPGLSGTPVLLLKPDSGVSTAACFQQLNAPSATTTGSDYAAPPPEWLGKTRNDLEASARALNPMIGEALTALSVHVETDDAWLVRMTGSGSTCFALFHEKGPRDAALNSVQQRFPDWWSAAAEIL